MSGVALVVVILAMVGVFFLAREVTSHNTPAPLVQQQKTLIQCADGSIRESCPAIVAQNPAPPVANLTDNTAGNGGSIQHPEAQQPDVSRSPLHLSDGALTPVPGSKTIRVGAGDAAVIQAYQIDNYQRCQVAGVIGPNRVSVTDGVAYYFSGVNASMGTLQDAMNEAAEEQVNDPNAHCSNPHVFILD